MGMDKPIYYSELKTPIGPLVVCTTDKGLCWIGFGSYLKCERSLMRWSKRWLNHNSVEHNDAACENVNDQLRRYFAGESETFDVELDLYGTPFQKTVWNSLSKIPFGETRSYKQVALAIGAPQAVRAIGGANNKNPIPIIIPCHRVVGSNGALVGYGGGLENKRFLLDFENKGLLSHSV